MFSKIATMRSTDAYWDLSERKNGISRLREALDKADAVVIGAGAGLSTSAGFVYTGERFDRYFHDFAEKYHFRDIDRKSVV